MAYSYLDDDALALVDDGSISAPMMRTIQGNAETVHDTRLPGLGWAGKVNVSGSGNPEEIELSSAWPGCFVAGIVTLPSGETWDSLTVRVEHGTVEFSGRASGSDAVRLHATVGDLTGRIIAPPRDPDDWEVTLDSDDIGRTELTAEIPTSILGREVVVFVWLWSLLYPTAQGTGTGTGGGIGSVDLSVLSTGIRPGVTGVPHLAMGLFSNDAAKGESASGPIHQIGYYDGATEYAYLIPYPPDQWLAASQITALPWETYTLGMVPIRGCAIELGAPVYPAPAATAYKTDSPLDERIAQLAERVRQMALQRLPGHASKPIDSSGIGRLWKMRHGLSGAAQLSTTYQVLDRASVFESLPSADRNGYRATILLAFQVRKNPANTRAANAPVELRFALKAYSAPGAIGGGTLLDTGAEVDVTEAQIVSSYGGTRRGESYEALGHSLRRIVDWDDWAFRGLLHFSDLDTRSGIETHDYTKLLAVQCEIDEDSLTYPLTLTIEAKTIDADQILTTAVVAATFSPRELE